MTTLCTACQNRPSGLEGHEGIFLSADTKTAAGRHLFRCSSCQAFWLREYTGDGTFAWILVPPEEAVGGHA